MTISHFHSALSAPASSALVCCILVNWNGWQDTVECLHSLRQQSYPNLQIIVVDNGSTNDSASRIREAHPWVTLVETGSNLGFPGGCNVGTRLGLESGAEYIWLLNNDTIAPDDTLCKLLHKAEANPRAGAIGAVLYYMHDPQHVQAWGGGRLNLWTGFVSHFTSPTSLEGNTYLTGACILMPRRVCEEVGLLYEGFFMYCDDSDFGLRLRKAGYEIVVAEDTEVLHKEGASSPKRSPVIDCFATTSGIRLLKRNAPVPQISIAAFLLLRLANRVLRAEWKNLAGVWRGMVVYFEERRVQFNERI
jgi:GT2 family glycosyltransferase